MKSALIRVICIVAAGCLFGAGSLFAGGSPQSGDAMMMQGDSMMMEGDSMMMGGLWDPAMEPAGGARILNYSDLASATMYAADGPVVLFFAASWCPDCRATLRELETDYASLRKDLTVVVVDYDAAGDLRTRYGVTHQHTFVQIDASGKQIVRWNGGGVEMLNKSTI